MSAWVAQPRSRDADEELPGACGGPTQRLTGIRHRPAAERPRVIRAQVGVAPENADILRVNGHLLCYRQPERRLVVLADVDLAGERRHGAGRRDMQPGASSPRPFT